MPLGSLKAPMVNSKKGEHMTETTYQNTLAKLGIKLANTEIQASQYEALYEEANQQYQNVFDHLNHLQSVIESDSVLKKRFDEAEAKLKKQEETNEI